MKKTTKILLAIALTLVLIFVLGIMSGTLGAILETIGMCILAVIGLCIYMLLLDTEAEMLSRYQDRGSITLASSSKKLKKPPPPLGRRYEP